MAASCGDMYAQGMDFDFFKSKTNPDVKPYRFMDDMTFVGLPMFVAGMAIKGDKAMFRVNNKDGKKNTQLLTDFKTSVDDYTQYFGPLMTVGMKLGGYEGRSDWPRLLASAAMSYGIMAAFVNGIKYTAKEMRPDGSTANSWPSGHTATSFVGATILHKEYGLTRSPWFSVAGYGVATATGVMRVLNNRHWVSDVMSGAGIGILSTELGYALGDILFKGKGLLRNDLEANYENPSFFSISMGVGIGGKDIKFNMIDDMQDMESHGIRTEEAEQLKGDPDLDVNVDFRAATVVDAEGAYFFNKYVGIGGRFRVRAMSAKSFGQYADISSEEQYYDTWLSDALSISEVYMLSSDPGEALTADVVNQGGAPITEMMGLVKSDHLAEFTASAGLYFNLPLNDRLSVGTKFLIGRSFTQELDIDGYAEGNVKNINYGMVIQNGDVTYLAVDPPVSTGAKWTDEWDYLTLGANSATSYGTGISLTYHYKSNFSWRLYCDYDYSKKAYTLTNDSYHFLKKGLTDGAYSLISNRDVSNLAYALEPLVFKKTMKMNYFTIGLSFLVNI
ncbi:MAG: phosphatase PAP2 family protein [Prevotella sp.]|nr:phosphatase PAP2 family protein [Prevotella sp.]